LSTSIDHRWATPRMTQDCSTDTYVSWKVDLENESLFYFEIANAFRDIYDHSRPQYSTLILTIFIKMDHKWERIAKAAGTQIAPGRRILIHHNLAPIYLHSEISCRLNRSRTVRMLTARSEGIQGIQGEQWRLQRHSGDWQHQ